MSSISELELWIFKFFLQDYCIIHIGLKNNFENRNPTHEERLTKSNIVRFDSKISYLAFRTEIDSPIGLWASSAISKAFEITPIKKRTSGGSIPISPFVTTLNVPALTYPSVNKDNNQHSPNENIRIGNFIDGTIGMIYLLLEEIN